MIVFMDFIFILMLAGLYLMGAFTTGFLMTSASNPNRKYHSFEYDRAANYGIALVLWYLILPLVVLRNMLLWVDEKVRG